MCDDRESQVDGENKEPVRRVLVHYSISGEDIDVERLTRESGITPVVSYRKGDSYVRKCWCAETGLTEDVAAIRSNSFWMVGTDDLNSLSVEAHLAHLLAQLEPVFQLFGLYASGLKGPCLVRFYIRYEGTEKDGGYEIDSAILKRLAALSNRIWVSFWGQVSPDDT